MDRCAVSPAASRCTPSWAKSGETSGSGRWRKGERRWCAAKANVEVNGSSSVYLLYDTQPNRERCIPVEQLEVEMMLNVMMCDTSSLPNKAVNTHLHPSTCMRHTAPASSSNTKLSQNHSTSLVIFALDEPHHHDNKRSQGSQSRYNFTTTPRAAINTLKSTPLLIHSITLSSRHLHSLGADPSLLLRLC